MNLQNPTNTDWDTLNQLPSPCFIYNLSMVVRRIASIRRAFEETPFKQYFPIKANHARPLIECCIQNGLGIDACSMGDLTIADILDIPASKISFTGTGLDEREMVRLKSRHIIPNLNSLEEVQKWARLFPGTPIGIRVSLPSSSCSHPDDYAAKMGISSIDWSPLAEVVNQSSLDIILIHHHQSSGTLSYKRLLENFSLTFNSIPSWVWKKVTTINFGGGWGLPYLRQKQLDLDTLIQGMIALTRQLKSKFTSHSLNIEIEPGEYLIGESGFLLTKVRDVRKINYLMGTGKTVLGQSIILDTPFPPSSGFRNPELLYPVYFKHSTNELDTESLFTKIYGCSNTPMDIINKGCMLPPLTTGQPALVASVGAYVPMLLSYFNQRDIPAEYYIIDDQIVKGKDTVSFSSYYQTAYHPPTDRIILKKGGDYE